MKRGNLQAFPSSGCEGMTYREWLAGMALQPLMGAMYGSVFAKGLESGLGKTRPGEAQELRKLIVQAACLFADELIAELEKP